MARTMEQDVHDENGFMPVSLTSLRVDSVTSFDIYFQPSPGQPFVLYAERNIQFTEEARQRLAESKVDQVFIHSSQLSEYSRYIEENLAAILSDNAIHAEEKTEILYSSASGVAESMLVEPQSRENLQRSREVVKHTVNFMVQDQGVFALLLKVLSSVYQVYTHSVNVVTYVVALAQRVGQNDPATLRELAVGALLHDIGKNRIPANILDCRGTLTQEQWEMMQRHPRFGYELLAESHAVGEIALDIVLHHHEKVRGGGYPDNLKAGQVSPFVRMVTIADVFDALTTDRPFRKARKSFPALSVMRTQVAADLDPDLFRTFVSMMGNPGS